jgi:hypothetical protein
MCHLRCSAAEIPEGALKQQLDGLVACAFRSLAADDVLNFCTAVTVMRVQVRSRQGGPQACVCG